MLAKFADSCVVNCRRFFSDNALWAMDLEKGLRQIRQDKKPGLLVIHRDGCGSCLRLKQALNKCETFAKKSKGLVCISLGGDQEPRTVKFAPDGGYVPRIIFLDEAGNVLESIVVGNKKDFKYFYNEQDIKALLANMDKVTSAKYAD